MNLHHKKYKLNSNNNLVAECLKEKIRQFKELNNGIGAESCCAVVEYTAPDGKIRTCFGNSQKPVKLNHYPEGHYKNDQIKCHGEAAAITHAIDCLGDDPDLAKITRIYVEMSPCANRCAPLIDSINKKMIVYFSFRHPEEVDEWIEKANALCKS